MAAFRGQDQPDQAERPPRADRGRRAHGPAEPRDEQDDDAADEPDDRTRHEELADPAVGREAHVVGPAARDAGSESAPTTSSRTQPAATTTSAIPAP